VGDGQIGSNPVVPEKSPFRQVRHEVAAPFCGNYDASLGSPVGGLAVAVGTTIADPSAQILTSASTHTALTKDESRRSVLRDRDAGREVVEPIGSTVGLVAPTAPVLADCAG
jgi:hypothetical protein